MANLIKDKWYCFMVFSCFYRIFCALHKVDCTLSLHFMVQPKNIQQSYNIIKCNIIQRKYILILHTNKITIPTRTHSLWIVGRTVPHFSISIFFKLLTSVFFEKRYR
uniref:Uncharacterized protein n=1 Tax=Oryza brachyantha TaxID=4533 RepID=J3MFA5_ORYBR